MTTIVTALKSLKWLLLAASIGIACGSASVLFLYGLELATAARLNNSWLLWLLPLSGALMSWIYLRTGKQSIKGNNLIIEQIYEIKEGVPRRMAPLVLFGTWLTHLFGGSAGREGTAVQMGGSIADGVASALRLNDSNRRILLLCGISGGFGSIFGTPIAGAVFSLEVILFSRLSYKALLPVLITSYIGHWTALLLGAQHAVYSVGTIPAYTWTAVGKTALAAVAFGIAAWLFASLTRQIKRALTSLFKHPALRSFFGGLIIIGLTFLAGTHNYLGLGLPLLDQAFIGEAEGSAFAWKTLFTAITLGAGFQGGEVTPLFVIGATLGNTLAGLLQLAAPFLAAIGLAAVFSSAANTPLAGVVMGVELFGLNAAGYLLIGCSIAYLFSGHTGIYSSQRRGIMKTKLYRMNR